MHPSIQAVSRNGLFKFVPLTHQLINNEVNLSKSGFFKDEPISNAIGVDKVPEAVYELNRLTLDISKDGVSFAAVHRDTGQCAGLYLNKIMIKNQAPSGFFKTIDVKHPTAKQFIKINRAIDEYFDCYMDFNTNCYFEICFGAVFPQFRGNRLSDDLIYTSLQIAQALKNGIDCRLSVDGKKLPRLATKPTVAIVYCESEEYANGMSELNFKRGKTMYLNDSLKIGDLEAICLVYYNLD